MGGGCDFKRVTKGMDLCSDGIVQYLDHGGGYTNLHM